MTCAGCIRLFPLLLAGLVGAAVAADGPRPSEFAWRATLELPAAASVARVNLPAAALQRLQSADARDVRVFNASGEAVAFALSSPATEAAPIAPRTATYPAFGLFSSTAATTPVAGAVQVRINEPSGDRTVWVQLDGAPRPPGAAAGATPVQAAIFATRGEKQPLSALHLQADLPANAPVAISVATSADLAQWTPVPVRGRVYRFEGAGAPSNTTLELERPLQLENQYLRLSWYGQEGVQVTAVTGAVAQIANAAPRERAPLGAALQPGKDALEWTLGFSTPIAALSLVPERANTLLPVRILGRTDNTQPWRELGQTLLYRLGSADATTTNTPASLGGASVRQLRVVAGNGLALEASGLQATVEFNPVQVLFLATGTGPFTLAAGRADTPSAALGSATLASVVQGKLDALPLARIVSTEQEAVAGGDASWGLFPGGGGGRRTVLWAVLIAGVLLLAGVAFALLRQLKAP